MMNLLPRTHQEFGQAEYWDKFFKKREKAFEWYGEYLELCTHLHKYIKKNDKILVVGCGNSKMSIDLYDSGFKDIINIDISQVVIKNMIELNKNKRQEMKFFQMDATAMSFANEEFSVVLDKGTLDALMTDNSEQVTENICRYFAEILRVLKNGGRYLCISLLQEHILNFVAQFFPTNACMLRIVRCLEAEQKTAETSSEGIAMPVFMVIATKFKTLPQQILEVNLGGEKMQRLQNVNDIVKAIKSIQTSAFVCSGLNKTSLVGCNEVVFELYSPNSDEIRYTVYVLDQPPARGNGRYAAFIVPQGREVDWLFSTPKGRRKLLSSAHQNRLAIVTLHRGQHYTSWEAVKDELAESIRNFSPHGLKEQIPYLSLGADVGEREIIERGHSQTSGDFVIEEAKGADGKLFRRLIFLSNQFVVQSEALVKTIAKPKNMTVIKKIDVGHLACQHHIFMAAGVNSLVLRISQVVNVLVIGLGGGGLCTFIHEVLRNVKLTAVEIDSAMLDVAKNFFDLKEDNRLRVEIDDGIHYLANSFQKGNHFDAILFDVDSKDLSLGMSCPPKSFVQADILEMVKTLIGSSGIFILNLVCRDEILRDATVKELKIVFKSVCCFKLEEDVNEIIYCCNDESFDLPKWKTALEQSSKSLNLLVKKSKLSKDDIIDVIDFIQELKI